MRVFGTHDEQTLRQLERVAGRAEQVALMADGHLGYVMPIGGAAASATPAFPGQTGFVGGSMGDDAVIVRGASEAAPEVTALQREALFSTVHGAGRVMSRTQAASKRRRGKVISPGRVTPVMMDCWVREWGVVLRGGGLDESPHVYRRLPKVLEAQGGTIEVLHTLRPLVVAMAGADEVDPYKD